jgi:hypothetical protein
MTENLDAVHREYCGLPVNAKCDNYSLHSENAADLLVPGWAGRGLTEAERDAVDAEADAEYLNCEGH